MVRSISIIATLAAFVGAIALLPARDPAKLVRGVDCSVLSEVQISTIVHAQMRMLPSDGNVCRYVSDSWSDGASVTVIAKHDVQRPPNWPPAQIRNLSFGDDAASVNDAVYLRRGDRAFLVVVSHGGEQGTADAVRIARALDSARAVVAHR